MAAIAVLRFGRAALKVVVVGALVWYGFWAAVLCFGWAVAYVFARAIAG